MIGSAIGLVVFVLILGGIGAVVYFAVRGGGGADSLTFRNLLRAYLRVAYLVSLVVFMVGAVMTLTAAFGSSFGHDFSYLGSYGGSTICTPAPDKTGCINTPGQGDDPRPKQDLIRGLSLLVAGLLIGGAHRAGQFAMESAQERLRSGLAKGEYLVGTVGFGLVSIIALPTAAYSVLSYNLISHNANGYGNDTPGPALATALVFLPAWGYYLVTFVNRVRTAAPLANPDGSSGPTPA